MRAPKYVPFPRRFAAACLALALAALARGGAVELTIDTGDQGQEIDGFGTYLAWWINQSLYTPEWHELYWSDLGASMVRIDLHIEVLRGKDGDLATPARMVEDLSANIRAMDFGAKGVGEVGGVAAAGKALAREPPKVIVSVYSPPHWMKGPEVDPITGEFNGRLPDLGSPLPDSRGGTLIDTEENLRQFGLYLASYVSGFRKTFGLPVYALSIQTQPFKRTDFGSAVYDPSRYRQTLKAVKAIFEEKGLDTLFYGPEDVTGDEGDPWPMWRHMRYVDAIRRDPEAEEALDVYAIHNHPANGFSAARPRSLWRQYREGRSPESHPEPEGAWWPGVSADGKRTWVAQAAGESFDFDGAMELAASMQDALVLGEASAFLYWLTFDGSDGNVFTLTDATDATAPKYVAAKHFFRHIRPEARRVALHPHLPDGVWSSAFLHPDNRDIAAVFINQTKQPQRLALRFEKASPKSFEIARLTTEGSPWTDVGPIPVSSGQASLEMPPRSLLTLRGAFPAEADLAPDPPIAAWLERWFGSADPVGEAALDASPARDGIPNLLKYALGLDPLAPQTHRLPKPKPVDGRLVLDVALNPEALDVRLNIEASGDLRAWLSGPEAVEILERSPERLLVRDRADLNEGPRFMRLRARLEPESPQSK